jgi:hypothetical protein
MEEPRNYTVSQKAIEEGLRLNYDTFKHLTTLSTGSILILVTFLEKLFLNPHWKILVAMAFVCFIVTNLSSVRLMVLSATIIKIRVRPLEEKLFDGVYYDTHFHRLFWTCWISFVLATTFLALFALRNLWS